MTSPDHGALGITEVGPFHGESTRAPDHTVEAGYNTSYSSD